jgi:adenylyltransferase/sulfurtransferase
VDLNPDARVTGIVGDVRSFGTGIAYRADVIVGALDNREARLYCNRLAARTGRHWVDGAIEALSGLARVFEPPDVCYECTMTEADWEHLAHRQSCRLLSKADLVEGKVPTTASTASLVAAIETQEVVKLLHRDRPGVSPLRGVIVFDGANNDAYPLTYPTDLNCLAHHFYADPVVVAVDGSMTATRLAEAVWPDASDDPSSSLVVELGDNHVIGWTCLKCGDVAPEHRPAALIAVGEGDCPKCGEPRQPEFVTSIEVPGHRAETPFGDLGIRIDEVLTIRSGVTEERFGWLAELDNRLPDTWGVPRPVRMDEETLNA